MTTPELGGVRWVLHVHNAPELRSCFVNLPSSVVSALQPSAATSPTLSPSPLPIVLLLSWRDQGDRFAWVTWSGLPSSSSSSSSSSPSSSSPNLVIELSPHFSSSLGLRPGASVTVHQLVRFGVLQSPSRLLVEPLSADDWEIIELQPDRVEDTLLQQIRVCSAGQTVPFLLDATLVNLKVLGSSDEPPGKRPGPTTLIDRLPLPLVLSNDSEVCVAPKPRAGSPTHDADDQQRSPQPMVFRLQPLDYSTRVGHSDDHPFYSEFQDLTALRYRGFVYAHPDHFDQLGWTDGEMVQLEPLLSSHVAKPPPSSSNSKASQSKADDSGQHQQEKQHQPVFVCALTSLLCLPEHMVVDALTAESLSLLPYERFRAVPTYNRAQPARIDSVTLVPACSRSATLPSSRLLHAFHRFITQSYISAELPRFICTRADTFALFKVGPDDDDGSGVGVEADDDDDPFENSGQDLVRCRVLVNSKQPVASTKRAAKAAGNYFVVRWQSTAKSKSLPFAVDVDHAAAVEPLGDSLPAPHIPWAMVAKTFGGYRKQLKQAKQFVAWSHAVRTPVSKRASGAAQAQQLLPRLALVTGSSGSGKSHLLNALANYFLDPRRATFVWKFDGGDWKGKKLSDVTAQLLSGFARARANGRSALLLFDSLDVLLDSAGPSPETATHSESAMHVAAVLSDCMRRFSGGRVAYVASCLQSDRLPPRLTAADVLAHVYELAAPDADGRRDILLRSLARLAVPRPDDTLLDVLVSRTQGYVGGDVGQLLVRVVHRASLQALQRRDHRRLHGRRHRSSQSLSSSSSSSLSPTAADVVMSISAADVERALDGFVPASLKSVKFESPTFRWSDVGGLADVREQLEQTFNWPRKYPQLFRDCPLRPRSGVLLYGPPGCGKTFLAGALASHCDLRLIAIKGPELLNKYIGASERSVREVFERAAAASPCLLFFDEFDAVAAKRGRDNTGVTDRVVNQLLTELDGVEESRGIFVLAATSRPDLLDPALLRPGRLDKSLYCPLPSLDDRRDILDILAAKLTVSDDDHELRALGGVGGYLAPLTERFSGADLQALLMNAQLAAIHDSHAIDDLQHSSGSVSNCGSADTPTRIEYLSAGRLPDNQAALIAASVCARPRRARANGQQQSSSLSPPASAIAIRIEHLKKALEETTASMSAEEMRRLEAAYLRFQNKAPETVIDQLQTLA